MHKDQFLLKIGRSCKIIIGPTRKMYVLSEAWEFSENLPTSQTQGAISHVFYFQQLSIACYQVSLYGNKYLE